MARKAIFTEVMDVLVRRIAQGDYMLKDLPGERRIAEEVGVSYMTARKAVQHLIDKRVLVRKANGALEIRERQPHARAPSQIVLLTPAYPSPHLIRSRLAIAQAAEKRRLRFRPVEYTHWYDPIVGDALKGSDGLIIIPSTEPLPRQLFKEFTSPSHKVVFFDDDLSEHGIPSIRLFARTHITGLFEHLWRLGHRRIDCLNTQGHNLEIHRRINHWQSWLASRGAEGRLWDAPAPAFRDPTELGLSTMHQFLRNPLPQATAIVCTTQPAAVGAIRACYERGIGVGRDVSICTINNEPTGHYLCPSLTGLEFPDVEPLLEKCFAWFEKSDEPWPGERLIEPERSSLFVGESTGVLL